jgi:hypothetical protein
MPARRIFEDDRRDESHDLRRSSLDNLNSRHRRVDRLWTCPPKDLPSTLALAAIAKELAEKRHARSKCSKELLMV